MSELICGPRPDEAGAWVTKADRAHGAIRQAVISGRLAPRAQINPKLIAEELGMSIIPVREALRRLEQEGLVVIKPHVGAAVREMPVGEITENLLIRSALEALAAEIATTHLSPDDLGKIETVLEQMERCIANGRFGRFGKLNRQFHLAIYNVVPERSLVRLIEAQWDRTPRGASVFSLVPDHAISAQKEHHLIFDALKRGDAAASSMLTREHKLRARAVHAAAFAKDEETSLEAAE